MKKVFLITVKIILFFYFSLLLTGCLKDKITQTYQIRTPVYEVLTKFRESIKSGPAVSIASPGKMTVYGKYIFLNEVYKGIHVIDNSNPAQPKNISFINIPGNVDLAITGSTLYADAFGDLVTFDITDPTNAMAKNFAINVFPGNSIYYYNGTTNPDSVNVIVSWIIKDTTVNYNPGNFIYPGWYNNCPNCMTFAAVPSASNSNGATTGTNGSTARFSIVNNFLYTVDFSSLTTFNISNNLQPALANTLQVGLHVETIYPFKDKLFIGSNNGVYMYDISSSPGKPSAAGEFTHVRGCDPVIADDDYAYVTLNDSSACLGFNNELQVVNIKDLNNSFLVKSYQLTHPTGLSKDGNTIFICDGKGGLKIYNTADVNNLQLIKQLKDAEVYDVVAQNGLAIVLGKDGIYQYDYADMNNIHLISKL
jgi:hypothetical protein